MSVNNNSNLPRKPITQLCRIVFIGIVTTLGCLLFISGSVKLSVDPLQLTDSLGLSAQYSRTQKHSYQSYPVEYNLTLREKPFEPPAYCRAHCHQNSTPYVGFPPIIYNGTFKKFLGGFAFRDMSDLLVNWPNILYKETSKESTRFVQRNLTLAQLVQCLGPIPIIFIWLPENTPYCLKRLYLENIRTEVLPNVQIGTILITGHSDLPVLSMYEHWDVLNHPKLIHWYGEEGVASAPKFTYLPRGVMYMSQLPHLYNAVPDKQSLTVQGIKSYIDHVLREFESGSRTKLISVNFSIRPGFRTRIWNRLCTHNLSFVECVPPTSERCNYNLADPNCKMDVLYKALLKNPFVLSPPGVGMDTYRTSEALYLGRFPVISESAISDYYADLPVVVVPNFMGLTHDFLLSQLRDLRDRADRFKLHKLDATYFQKTIEMKRQEVLRKYKLTDQPRQRCWGP